MINIFETDVNQHISTSNSPDLRGIASIVVAARHHLGLIGSTLVKLWVPTSPLSQARGHTKTVMCLSVDDKIRNWLNQKCGNQSERFVHVSLGKGNGNGDVTTTRGILGHNLTKRFGYHPATIIDMEWPLSPTWSITPKHNGYLIWPKPWDMLSIQHKLWQCVSGAWNWGYKTNDNKSTRKNEFNEFVMYKISMYQIICNVYHTRPYGPLQCIPYTSLWSLDFIYSSEMTQSQKKEPPGIKAPDHRLNTLAPRNNWFESLGHSNEWGCQ